MFEVIGVMGVIGVTDGMEWCDIRGRSRSKEDGIDSSLVHHRDCRRDISEPYIKYK